ncbi:MAG TPA: protealysin inhibitor emfourin [Candidatus Entotheonella sp.]|jgi:hypothetical protein
MRIYFERSGGFAGNLRPWTAEVDTEQHNLVYGAKRLKRTLSPEEVRDLLELVESAGFFALPSTTTPSRRGTNQFQYVVTIETQDKRHTVRTTEGAVSAALHPCLII